MDSSLWNESITPVREARPTHCAAGSAPRTIAANTYYKLRLLIQGTSISLFFNSESTATVAAVDSALTSGSYGGLHAYAGGVQTVVYKDFNIVAAPPPATLFSDDFNRTSGMGSNWSSVYGSYTTNGSSAVSGTPPIQGNWEKVATAIGSTNVAVVARLMVPQGALDSGVVARSSTGAFDSDLYSAQIATDGNVYLYRRDNYGWTTLASSPATIQANTWYTLKLITTGSGPVHLEAWLDGTQKIVLDDTNTPNLNGSGVGIECYDANVQYDSFSVLQQ